MKKIGMEIIIMKKIVIQKYFIYYLQMKVLKQEIIIINLLWILLNMFIKK